jgi:adenine-specific DNA-methyltransferase
MRIVKEYLQSFGFNKKPDKKILAIIGQKYDNIGEKDSEEQVKKYIGDMLSAFRRYDMGLNEDNVDLVVRNRNKELIGIFECKRLENKMEMLEYANLNKKALGELIVNFKSLSDKNEIPDWLVASNGKEWFIFSKTPFVRFWGNVKVQNYFGSGINQLPNLFPQYRGNFYSDVSSFLKNNPEILLDFSKYCLYTNEKESIYYFLSPDLFLHEYNPNVGNALDKQFYKELLYLFGLKEEENQGKKTIVPNEVTNTFYSQISSRLDDFEKSLELIVIWLNRILFLKLFEARLVRFNNDDLSFKFLNKKEIPDTTTLETLFFRILAVPESERLDKTIPYLNSSLFEKKPQEGPVPISSILGNGDVQYFKDTILKENNGNRRTGSMTLLEYLFKFLDAYDFVDEQNEFSLISPVVLGLIFEKINGYKDGSYYTPTAITDYMAECALERTILVKVKDQLNLDYSDFEEFKGFFPSFTKEERTAIRKIIKTLTIVDPAVGSGHFLVSALNVLLQIWFDLRMIPITPHMYVKYDMRFENSDMRLYENDEPFVYRKNSADQENMEFQKAVFQAKKQIIENNLFGVDNNPKSVEIARLRLWIELLKNTYYKPDGTMETLPNIDINIKEGNSLLASVPSLRTDLFTSGGDIPRYRSIWTQYQNASDKKAKQAIEGELVQERNGLIKLIVGAKNQNENENENRNQYDRLIWTIDFPQIINDDGSFLGFDVVIANPPYIGEKGHKDMFREIKPGPLREFYQGKMDLFYFFFHLALNLTRQNSGIAFVTTNYYPTATGAKKLREDFKNRAIITNLTNFNELKIFESALGQHNMITMLQRGHREDAIAQTCITKRKGFATPEILQEIFAGNDVETGYYRLSQDDLYDGNDSYMRMDRNSGALGDALPLILDRVKEQGIALKNICNVNTGIMTGADKVSKKHIQKYGIKANIGDGIFVLSDEEVTRLDLSERDKAILKPWFKNSDIYRWGTNAHTERRLILADKRLQNLNGNALENYLMKFQKIHFDSSSNFPYLARPRDIDYCGKKIVVPQRSPRNTFGYNEIPWYASEDVYFITRKDKSVSLKYILALLNSKLYYLWLYHRGKRKGETLELYQTPLTEIPIRKIVESEQQPFIDLVDRILLKKQWSADSDVSGLECEVDQLVYQLYDLTPDEIAFIESSFGPGKEDSLNAIPVENEQPF